MVDVKTSAVRGVGLKAGIGEDLHADNLRTPSGYCARFSPGRCVELVIESGCLVWSTPEKHKLRSVPFPAVLADELAAFMVGKDRECGGLDSDYVFVNLWGRPYGHPLSYPAVYDLVRRLRRRTGIDFDPHWLRHTAATRMLRDGIGIDVVARILGHVHVTTTAAIYGHLTVEDAREVMERAGWFTGRPVSW